MSTSGLDGHIAISGCPSMSHLFVDTFFGFGVFENCFRARITVILTSEFIRLYESVTMTMCSITSSDFIRQLENVQIPFFILLPRHLTIFSL